MISLDNSPLIWFGRSPMLPPRYAKELFVFFNDNLISLMNMDSSEGDYDRLFMESWHFWKSSGRVFEDKSFGRLSSFMFTFPLLLLSPFLTTSLHYTTLAKFNQFLFWWVHHIPISHFLLQYPHILYLHLLNKGDGLFPHNVICYISE